ncbi:head-tail connector protein [Angustibacter luteus]|uniref:Phage gp6-like head-tail connector protein n=1 Tax=Angustibacter luteus TaxID=658456 RepID=A0ABW1JJV4_9ACTN
MSALLLADAKEHLNVTITLSDAELQQLIDACEKAIAHWTGPLEPTTKTKRVAGGSSLFLPPPVISLTSVTPVLPGAVAMDLAGFDIDPETGQVTNYSSLPLYADRYIVVYQAGYTTLPDDLMLAVKELLRHVYSSSQRKPGSTPSQVVSPYFLPNFVETLIEPYRGTGFA